MDLSGSGIWSAGGHIIFSGLGKISVQQLIQMDLIVNSHGLPGRVHGQYGYTDVHGDHRKKGRKHAAQSTSAAFAGMLGKSLAGDPVFGAKSLDDGHPFTVPGISLTAVGFDDNTLTA